MTQIEKIRKKSGGYISYKFYGIKDLSAGFDVKFIIDNHVFLKEVFYYRLYKTHDKFFRRISAILPSQED